MSDGWFCFQRDGNLGRPQSFQSPELDGFFLADQNVKLSAAWCISSRDKRLIYFWGNREQFNGKTDIQGRFGYCVRKFGPFFEQLSDASGMLLTEDIFRAASANPIKYLGNKRLGKDILVEIFAGKGFIFLYQLKENPADEQFNIRTYLLDRSEKGFDFCRQAAAFFERIPKDILNVGIGADKLLHQFFGPNCYDLSKEVAVPFAWPWQKSFEMRNGSTHPKQIPTISLVMDIRNSSSAMLLTRDAPKFAGFIDKVVEGAREIITNNGGYFDKDTGDGVVGHFEGSDISDTNIVALTKALVASRLVSTSTTRLCMEYQENLNLKLRGLGCAVGLFAGAAVWLYSWRGVRAIGGSVVNASRICGNANPGEVGYCNTVAQIIHSAEVKSEIFPLTGVSRPIEISEVRGKAAPEATFVQIS